MVSLDELVLFRADWLQFGFNSLQSGYELALVRLTDFSLISHLLLIRFLVQR